MKTAIKDGFVSLVEKTQSTLTSIKFYKKQQLKTGYTLKHQTKKAYRGLHWVSLLVRRGY